MKASADAIARALDAADSNVPLYLLYGPDASGASALAARLARALGDGAQRVDLDAATLKSDPARLSDEVGAISLFGGRSWIRITLSPGDDVLKPIETLLDARVPGNPVVVIAPALKASGALAKLVLAHNAALAFGGFAPSGESAERLAAAMAREAGLKLAPGIAHNLATNAQGDRAILRQEIEKYALFLDTAPDRPATLNADLVEALGADARDGDFSRLCEAAMGGAPSAAADEIARLGGEGVAGVPLVRAVAKRALGLAEPGRGGAWSPPRLAILVERLLGAECAIKTSNSLGTLAGDAELIAVARAARGR